jgi:hypothetical protein
VALSSGATDAHRRLTRPLRRRDPPQYSATNPRGGPQGRVSGPARSQGLFAART